MKRILRPVVAILAMLLVSFLACLIIPGCGDVYLRGQALTAAETSAVHAYAAARRDPNGAWTAAYLDENYRQWRFFVRAARRDPNWGPVLGNE